ncbi:MAG: deoxyribodipyrimidine photo-lyase [Candidatus Caenarcaniphilales bacterium]|nr:deoxyribodipyrimidine photo-lyase [Candidatus Caenarcaniphilales bacterium]
MSHNYEKVLFWMRRDLRLNDNAGLAQATVDSKQVFLVFIFDTQILDKLQDKDDRRITYLWEVLEDLQATLTAQGASIIILHGDPVQEIPILAQKLGVQSVYTNRDYEAYALHRDDQVQAKLNDHGITFHAFKDQIIFESDEVLKSDGNPYTVFTPFKRNWIDRLTKNPDAIAEHKVNHKLFSSPSQGELKGLKQIRDLKEIGFKKAADLIISTSQKEIRRGFEAFLTQGIFKYKSQRDFPAIPGTSNISPHLRFGTLGIRECFRLATACKQEANPIGRAECETWMSELIWREFYSMILQAFPHVQHKSFRPEYENLLWRVDQKLLEAWKEGMTGYPIVDAGMRNLKQSGQMPNRVRMITASFLSKDLLLDWREGEAHFARYLLDFDLASNNGGWQWASSTGTDAAPYFRIFNPQLQGKKFDADVKYIKCFIPELKEITASQIHELSFSVKDYPKPIIRHDLAREAVLSLFRSVKAQHKGD